MMNCTGIVGDGSWRVRDNSFPWYNYLLCLLIAVGVVGNSLVIYIQSRLGGARVGGATATNRLIMGLAVADLLTAIFIIPVPEFVDVPHTAAGEFYCRVIEPKTLTWIAFMGSVYTLATISIERYIAVVHPFAYKVWMHKRLVKYAFLAIWISAIVINLFGFLFRGVNECGLCKSNYPSATGRKVNGIFVFLIEYFGPLCVMSYTNIRSILTLRRNSFQSIENGGRSTNGKMDEFQALRRRFATMLAVIFASFMILWTPDQLGFLLYNLKVIGKKYTSSVVYLFFVKIALLNASVTNPIIYSVWLPDFRNAVKNLLLCRGIKKYPESRTEMTSSDTI